MDKLQETKCPLCGADNHCAMAAQTGNADEPQQPCWCVNASIPEETLAAIPEADRGLRCICPACAGYKRQANER